MEVLGIEIKWNHKLNHTYLGMIARCYHPQSNRYEYYGNRGIKVCDEWKNDKKKFFEWALNNGFLEHCEKYGGRYTQLDRVDNNKDYSPDNCRWATAKENSDNRRTSYKIKYNGKEKSLTQWCRELNLDYVTVFKRIKYRKWSVEKAFTTPTLYNFKERKDR